MATAPKKNKPTSAPQPPSFEEALGELEKMVDTMESDQLPLEKLIANYERGAKLVSHCEIMLNDARKRLELITLKPKANAATNAPAADSDQPKVEGSTSNNNNDDEIRLF